MDNKIGEANNDFALQILSVLNVNDSNVLFSPWSLFNALAMTFVGARGSTADPVWKVWRFSPRSWVCNQNLQVCKCAIQRSAHLMCAMWSIWFVHIWQTRIGGRALGKILHFSSLAFKLLPVCQCDHFRCITALFLSLPRLCKYSSNTSFK